MSLLKISSWRYFFYLYIYLIKAFNNGYVSHLKVYQLDEFYPLRRQKILYRGCNMTPSEDEGWLHIIVSDVNWREFFVDLCVCVFTLCTLWPKLLRPTVRYSVGRVFVSFFVPPKTLTGGLTDLSKIRCRVPPVGPPQVGRGTPLLCLDPWAPPVSSVSKIPSQFLSSLGMYLLRSLKRFSVGTQKSTNN